MGFVGLFRLNGSCALNYFDLRVLALWLFEINRNEVLRYLICANIYLQEVLVGFWGEMWLAWSALFFFASMSNFNYIVYLYFQHFSFLAVKVFRCLLSARILLVKNAA